MRSFGECCLFVTAGGVLLAAGCRDTGAKDAVATYSYSAGPYSETVALRPDGRYVQSETQRGDNPVLGAQSVRVVPVTLRHSGAWRLLDGPGGHPIPLPSSAEALPHGAVVALDKALPFGLTWENRQPVGLAGDRILPADQFRLAGPQKP